MSGPRPVAWIQNLQPAIHGADPTLGVLDFSANGNVIGSPPGVADAIHSADLRRYPDREAIRLRHAIAARDDVPVETVVVGNGSTELIWAVARGYLGPGLTALQLGPTYGEYEVASRATGARMEHVAAWSRARGRKATTMWLDVESLVSVACDYDCRVLWLCHPNNPTGLPFDVTTVRHLALDIPDSLIVVDEAYLTLADSVETCIPLVPAGNVVVLRSMAKDLGLAGLRLGYAIAPSSVADVLLKVVPPWSASALAQVGGMAALADPDHLDRARLAVAEARTHLLRGLKALGLQPFPSVTNFVLVPVGSGGTIRQALLQRGLAVRDCSSFGLPDCIRIGVRSIPDQDVLLAALGEMLPG